MKSVITIACSLMLLTAPAIAQNYLVRVHGMVCELCSYGVAKNIRKLPFVDKSAYENGVKVDIKNQQVFVAISQETPWEKATLFEAIEDGGYNPINIWRLDAQGNAGELVE